MATSTTPRTTALHTGTTDPSGSPAASSSEPALGSTGPTTSTATLITASIHITATVVHFRDVETRPSITSMETRCVVAAVTQAAVTQAAATQAEAIARKQREAQSDRCRLASLAALFSSYF